MNAAGRLVVSPPGPASDLTSAILEHRRRTATVHRRGWLMRRALLGADAVGLVVAFAIVESLIGSGGYRDKIALNDEIVFFVATLPIWLVGAKLFGLYDRDEERADYSTIDELAGVFLLMTVGVFLAENLGRLTGLAHPDLVKVTAFWALAIVLVTAVRTIARTLSRRSVAYLQNAVVVGAGEVGQLMARKLLHHSEYRLNLVGFVDSAPRPLHKELEHVRVLGGLDALLELVGTYDVDRVIFASRGSYEALLPLVRSLRDRGVQVDIVPRLFEVVGPKVSIHSVEGIPLLGLPPVRIPRSARAFKRAIDMAGALSALVVVGPLLGALALAIRLDSKGPVFFHQRRLGKDMKEFTLLKFRTMRLDTDEAPHREYIEVVADRHAVAESSGLYKLSRDADITRVGRFLRRFSLDELPQLLNVLRGDMSLVGPRPCLRYELDHFEPHHYDRFLVPAGLTGLWQVRARSHSTFSEALDLDVLYAQSWSLRLDLSLLARTPLQLLRAGTTA